MDISALPMLEPLSTATQTALKPMHLFESDRLMVDLDKDGTRFVVRAVRARKPRAPFIYNGGLALAKEEYEGYASAMACDGWLRKVPERKQVSYGEWILGGTDFTALILKHQWPEDKIIWQSEEARLFYLFLLSRFLMQTRNSVVSADFKVNKNVPEMPEDFIDHPELPLTGYQKVALHMSLAQEAFALFMQQGTGKTPVAISRICTEAIRTRKGQFGKKRMMRVLVICPKQTRTNWQNEIDRFATVPGKVSIAKGGLLRRIKAISDAVREESDCAFGVCIMSYESIERTWDAVGKVPWDLVIMDESHYIKGRNTKRFKASKNLREITHRRMILTGTPIANTPMDLWTQFEFLGEGLSGFMTHKNFRKFYGKYRKTEGSSIERLIGLQNMPLIKERLARMSFSITKKETDLDLPEKTFNMVEVTMTKKQAGWYMKILNALVLEIQADKEKHMTTEHILTKLLRLAQITSGHVKWDDEVDLEGEVITRGRVEQIVKANPKVEATIQMLQETADADPDCKTLIWCCFIEDIRVLTKRMEEEGIRYVAYHPVAKTRVKDAEIASETFNLDPSIKVFIGNPQSGGEGLNLLGYDFTKDTGTTYCGHEIFFSQNWSAVLRSQAEDRAHRRGTRRNVRITDLCVPGTIDEEIRNRVVLKRKMAMEIQDIQEILENVLNTDLDLED